MDVRILWESADPKIARANTSATAALMHTTIAQRTAIAIMGAWRQEDSKILAPFDLFGPRRIASLTTSRSPRIPLVTRTGQRIWLCLVLDTTPTTNGGHPSPLANVDVADHHLLVLPLNGVSGLMVS